MPFTDDDATFAIVRYIGSLAVVGVALALVGRMNFSLPDNREKDREEVSRNIRHLEHLKESLSSKTADYETLQANAARLSLRIDLLRRKDKELRKTVQALAIRIQEIETEKTRVTTDFSEYVSTYRATTWRKAVGQHLRYIVLKSGRRLDNVVIRQVTATGLNVMHSKGYLKVSASELSFALRDRFQWSSPVPKSSE